MSDSWEQRRKAKEEEYFHKREIEALQRIRDRESNKPRLSPITGEPMEQLTIMGVVIDRCPTSQGIWLDAGELEQIIEASKQGGDSSTETIGFLDRFFGLVTTKKQ